MTEFGFFLSSEEHGPRDLIEQAQLAEQHGLGKVWISDHFHPWLDSQGHSPFVWTTIGGIGATTSLEVTTAVTCPTIRIHPVINAHAAATCAHLLNGRFRLGVGTGENLNEHVLGDHWPPAEIRLEMLAEAIDIMKELWKGGSVTRRGIHYTVENARIFTRPDEPIPVPMSAFGPKATEIAAQVADGFMTTSPDDELLQKYRELGGTGPSQAGVKICWGPDEAACRKTAFELWKSSSVPGQLSQDLPMPSHFEQAAELVTEDMVAEKIPCGPDTSRHAETIKKYVDAGFDEIFIGQIGDPNPAFFDWLETELLPKL
jgi:G6PDH family F420-dependent oxidoreductase